MPLRPDMDLLDYWKLFVRRKWQILFSILFVMFGAVVYNVVVPELYKSTTTILIIPQRVPESFVQSTVSIGVEGRLATIEQQVTSRTRLTTVMDELGLFKKAREKSPPEVLIKQMRERIEIDVAQDRGRGRGPSTQAFSISFLHEEPKLAMLTASRLASLFIDENLRNREQQAVGTSEFLDSQLQSTKVKLEALEEKVKRYKLQFMGELPQELQSNMNTLTRLQEYYKTNSDGIRAAEDRKVLLETQLSALERSVQTVVQEDGKIVAFGSQDETQVLANELAARRARLTDLTAKYTDRYPEVIRLRREIAELEKKISEGEQGLSPQAGSGKEGSGKKSAYIGKSSREIEEIRRLKAQIAATESEISSLKQGRTEVQRNIAAIQSKVDRAPRREQELISLTRDYENMKKSYDDLLKKKLEADIAQNLEVREKGEQFQIIDPANYPEKPFKPDRKKIFGIALFLACALGFGGAIGLEMADPSLKGPKDFKHFFDLPVLATIPILQDDTYHRRQTIRKAFLYGGIVSFVAAAFVFVLFYGQKILTLLNN